MRKSFFVKLKRIIMITTASALMLSTVGCSGCGKKDEKVDNEPATTKTDVIRETGDTSPTEGTTEEQETVLNHVAEGDRRWLDETLYTDEERAAMQFTVDGKTYDYDGFLEMTNTKFACWRDQYIFEIDALGRGYYMENVADSEKSDLWKNTIYPKLQDEDEAEKVYKQISEDAVAMVAGMAQDDNGLISKGKTAGYTAYVFDDNSGVGKPCVTDDDVLACDIDGIVTRAKCTDITFHPEDPNGFAVASVIFTFISKNSLGEAYDLEAVTSISFVYIENEEKWMAYDIGEPNGYYTVYEKDGRIGSTVIVLDENSPRDTNGKYTRLGGKYDLGYDIKQSDREAEFGNHFYYYVDLTNNSEN